MGIKGRKKERCQKEIERNGFWIRVFRQESEIQKSYICQDKLN